MSHTYRSDFITVSPHPMGKIKIPAETLFQYDVVINVSDHMNLGLAERLFAKGVHYYWFPLGESFRMPLENIYGALYILWNAEKRKQQVLLHCVAGRNRSRMILECYNYMMKSELHEESSLMLNVKDDCLPGIYRLEVFLQKCLEVFLNPAIANGEFIDWVKRETFGF